MKSNLSRLKSKRNSLSGGGSSRKKKRIEAAMRRKGCFEKPKTRNAKVEKRDRNKQNTRQRKRNKNLLSDLFGNKKKRKSRQKERREAVELASRDNSRRSGVRVTKKLRKRSTLVEQVFGVRTYSNDSRSGKRQLRQIDRSDQPVINYNTFRTMCVRVSDGYYFPVSFSTTKNRFREDRRACQQLCPGAETELYYHRMPSESAEDMVSYKTGRAYASEPFAFSYRKVYDSKNSCRFAAATDGATNASGFVEVAGGSAKLAEAKEAEENKKKEEVIGTPVYRVDSAIDPEQHENDKGSLTLATAKVLFDRNNNAKPVGALATTSDGREIRAVGPRFFPVQ